MAGWTDVAKWLGALDGVEPGKAYGLRAWRLKDKLLAWERPLRKSDLAALGAAAPTGPILGVRVPLEVKEALLQSKPKVYFTTPHFDGYAAILVRLPKISVVELKRLLTSAHADRAAVKPTRPRRNRSR